MTSNFRTDFSIKSENNIEFINDNNVSNLSRYEINEQFVEISGWFIVDEKSIPKTLFLLVDNKPLISNNNFQIITNSQEQNTDVRINWSIFFLSGYFKDGCHTIELIGDSKNEKLILSNDFIICNNI